MLSASSTVFRRHRHILNIPPYRDHISSFLHVPSSSLPICTTAVHHLLHFHPFVMSIQEHHLLSVKERVHYTWYLYFLIHQIEKVLCYISVRSLLYER